MSSYHPYRLMRSSVAYVEVEDAKGDLQLGSAFHVGDGVFVTARHVVAGGAIRRLGTTIPHRMPINVNPALGINEWKTLDLVVGQPEGPHLPNDDSDIAVLVMPRAIGLPSLRLGNRIVDRPIDDWTLDNVYLLDDAVIMGYPRIPFTADPPALLSLRAQVNAVVSRFNGGHRHYIVSSMARGGFSGGPVVQDNEVIGLVTESLGRDGLVAELGFMAVLSVDAIFACLKFHKLMPDAQKVRRDGQWDSE